MNIVFPWGLLSLGFGCLRPWGPRLLVALTLLGVFTSPTGAAIGVPIESRREKITKIVGQILRADYEGDQVALKHLYDDLAPFTDDKELGARVRYWRGFAQWRRAFNGFNDSVEPRELEQDLKLAIQEFEAAIAKDPTFVDAKVAAGSALGVLMWLYGQNPALAPEFKERARRLEGFNKASRT